MHGKFMSTLLAAAFAVALTGGALEAQGKGKGSDKGDGKGSDKARAADNRGSSERGARSVVRGNDDRGNRGRGNDAQARDNRGQARAAEVREVGGAVAGPADRAVDKRAERDARKALRGDRKAGRFYRAFDPDDAPNAFRVFAVSPRFPERFLGRVATLALARGVPEASLVIRPLNDRVVITNPGGVVLLDLDERRARNLGAFRVVTLDDDDDDDDDDREGAPAFCRSGAGHPNWGRQWCLDKGFGLGADRDYRWGRAVSTQDVVLRRTSGTGDLTRDVLATVLGDVVFNRLAAHAITLGLVEPLAGRWAVEPTGRRVLLVNSGTVPVAEIVDADDDDRADVLLVALRPW